MNSFDLDYQKLIVDTLRDGSILETRGTRSLYLFGTAIKHDMRTGFPASTLANFYPESAISEMLMFDLQSYGEVSERWLTPGLLKVWKNYVAEGTDYVPGSYCENWRQWDTDHRSDIDQLKILVNNLKTNPTSRSHVVQTYNPSISFIYGGMPNCGISMVFSSDGRYLDLLQTNRSIDIVTGMRGDFCRYGVLLELIGVLTGLTPRILQFSNANSHIYEQDIPFAEQLAKATSHELPTFTFVNSPSKLETNREDWTLTGYCFNKNIKNKAKLDLGDIKSYRGKSSLDQLVEESERLGLYDDV